MPTAAGIFPADFSAIQEADLTNFTQVRFRVNKLGTAGSAASLLILRYATTYTQTVASYLDIGASVVSASANVANTYLDTGWINLVAGAKAEVFIVPIGISGNGTLDPQFGSVVPMVQHGLGTAYLGLL